MSTFHFSSHERTLLSEAIECAIHRSENYLDSLNEIDRYNEEKRIDELRILDAVLNTTP